jgi:hypothetical protein
LRSGASYAQVTLDIPLDAEHRNATVPSEVLRRDLR